MRSFTDIFIKHPVLAVVVNLVILLVGWRALTTLPVQQYPKIESSSVVITTVYYGASAETVRGFLTTPIERVVSAISGVDYIESTSRAGLSTVTVRMRLNHSSTAALAEVTARLQQVRSELPAEAEPPVIEVQRADRPYASFYLSFTSTERSVPAVTDWLSRTLQPQLATLTGVQRVTIEGGRQVAMRVWIDPDRLAALNLSPGDVHAALRRNNYLAAVGQTKGNLVQVDLHEVALGLAHGGEEVVAPQRGVHVAGREVERGEAVRVDPDPHGNLAAALDGHALDARQCRQLRLQRSQQPIGHGRHAALCGREAEVERRVRPIGALHLDHRRLGFRRQLRADLLEPRSDLGQRRRAAVVQPQAHRDGAEAGAAGRLDVINAADRGHDTLDRRGQEAANGLGAGAVVDRGDHHGRALDLRVLLHRQRRQRAPTHEQDHEVDDHRQHWILDEDVGQRARAALPVASSRFRFSVHWSPGPARAGVARDRDAHRIAQLERPRSGHPLSGGEPREDHDLVAEHRAARNLPRVRTGLAVLVRRDHEHLVAARSLAQRAHGDGNGRARRADGNADAHRGARCRRVGGALDPRADHGVAGRGVDARVDCDDPGRGRRRVAGGEDVDALADAKARGDPLGDREVHVHGVVDPLQCRELGALVQVLARVHVGQAHARAERRADRLAGDDRPGARDLRQRDVVLRARAVHFDLRHGTVLARALHAVERRLRERGLRLLCL